LEGREWPRFLLSVSFKSLGRQYVEYPRVGVGEVFIGISSLKKIQMKCSDAQMDIWVEGVS